jgi:polyhydroxyalkanoate synthesis regulator phasin
MRLTIELAPSSKRDREEEEIMTLTSLIRKGLLVGLGAAVLTKERAESLVDELVDKGELTQKDRPKAVQELLNWAEEEERSLQQKVKETLAQVVRDLNLPTKEDLKRLESKLERLEKRLSERS